MDSHDYQLVHDVWWVKSRGYVATTPAGDELNHGGEIRSEAIGWAWQFAIFALGALPAAAIVAVSTQRWRRRSPGGDL